MIFQGKEFWHNDGVYQLVDKTATGRPYRDWLLCTDDPTEIVEFVKRFRNARRLPVLTLEDYKGRFWEKS
jgi:hypothetical protein